MKFEQLALSPSLVQVTQELKYEEMTPIQAKSIPLLLEGKDVIGQSKTGSGKTAAFTLPILQNLELKSDFGQIALQALILCPTRELCTQVTGEVRKLGRKHPGLNVTLITGGQPFFHQSTALSKGTHILVGTPGRVLDHLKRGTLKLDQVRCLVLDEADRMLDMGFQDEMEKILKALPPRRQTVLFSATFPATIETLSRTYQRQPVRVTIENEKQSQATIHQVSYEVPQDQKLEATLWLLQQNQPTSGIIFCNLKTSVIELTEALKKAGVSVACLHGDMEQNERDRVMAKFRNLSIQILIATDVAARGIDVQDLDLVLNFDLPAKPEIYVHRIGRTGRAGKRGFAISLVTAKERGKIHAIEQLTETPVDAKKIDALPHLEAKNFKQILKQGAQMETLYISGGRKEKVRAGDILGALTGDAGKLSASEVGKIEIHDRFAYVAITKNFAHIAIQRLRDGRIKGRKFNIELVK